MAVNKVFKYSGLFFFILILLFIFTQCSTKDEPLILATFSGGNVTFDDYLDHYLLSTKYKPEKYPTEENLKDIVKNKALEKMSIQEAKELNIEQDSLYQSVLRNNGRRLLYQRYVQEEFTSAVVTDSLIRKFYSEFSPQYRMYYIMRPFLSTSTDDFISSQKKVINEAYGKLLKGMTFEDAVKEYSQDIATNQKGGDIGWVIRESLGDEKLRLVMDTLTQYTYSQPFKGYGGFYIMYKGDTRNVKVPPFEDVKNNIWKTLYRSRKAYIQEKVDQRFEDLITKYNYTELNANIDSFIKKHSPKKKISNSTSLEFENISASDKKIKVASYDGGYVLIGDIFADSKKAPTNKYEFTQRLKNIAQQHLFAKHAKELDLQNIPDLKNQIEKMKSSLLSSILYKKYVKDPAHEELMNLEKDENFNKVKARSDLEKKFREEYEKKLNSKYNFDFVNENFSDALELARIEKEKQNSNNGNK